MNVSPPYRMTRLDNGLRIVSETLPYVRSISAGIWLGAGSRYEDGQYAGASHFIEHMLFKGTNTRSARDLAEQVDAVGGQLNAFTGKEYTCYYARMLDEHLGLAVELLSDMIVNSLFDPEHILKEQGVILEEIRMYQDSPDELVHDTFAQTLWPDDNLGRPVLGSPDSVSGLDHDRLLDYFHRLYSPQNMVVAVAGNVDHDRLVEHVSNHLAGLEATGQRPEVPSPQSAFRLEVVSKPIEQVHICVGTEGVPFGHSEFHSLGVLSTILGGGSSSRLFQKIREEHGLAYSVYSYETSYHDAGMFVVYAGTGPDHSAKALELILSELEAAASGEISDEEVDRARQQMRGGMTLGLEGMNARMNRMGRWLLLRDRIEPVDEVLQQIESVNRDRVMSLARELLVKDRLSCAVVGPVPDEVSRVWNS